MYGGVFCFFSSSSSTSSSAGGLHVFTDDGCSDGRDPWWIYGRGGGGGRQRLHFRCPPSAATTTCRLRSPPGPSRGVSGPGDGWCGRVTCRRRGYVVYLPSIFPSCTLTRRWTRTARSPTKNKGAVIEENFFSSDVLALHARARGNKV